MLLRETIRLDGRAVPGRRKQRRRHDKGRLPTREVSLVFLPEIRAGRRHKIMPGGHGAGREPVHS